MNELPLRAPQLITGARMLYLSGYPKTLQRWRRWYQKSSVPEAQRSVFMNQYIVDTTEQTSSAGLPGAFGPYSLTLPGRRLGRSGCTARYPRSMVDPLFQQLIKYDRLCVVTRSACGRRRNYASFEW